jgi:hypothetical protein
VDPIIDLARGAEDDPLAVELCDRIRNNLLLKPHKLADFRGLRATVLVVAEDRGESLTLRFDHGRLTIHEGAVGVPSVTLCGDTEAIRGLADLPLSRWLKLPVVGLFSRRAPSPLRDTLSRLANGKLLIYGLYAHPRQLLFLLRVLSADG